MEVPSSSQTGRAELEGLIGNIYNNIILLKVPQSLIIGLILTSNLHGSLNSSCLDFRPHGLTNIKVAIDG